MVNGTCPGEGHEGLSWANFTATLRSHKPIKFVASVAPNIANFAEVVMISNYQEVHKCSIQSE